MPKIYSSFADQEDWRELLEDFAECMPARITELVTAMKNNNASRLLVLVHQLRGACGSYGFHSITSVAAEVENSLRSSTSIESLQNELSDLVDQLSNLTAETPCPAIHE